MLNTHLMGLGGSQYLVLEMAIAFAERGYDVYVDSLAIKSRGDLVKIANFFRCKQVRGNEYKCR